MRTLVRGAASLTADDATVSEPNQRSRVPLTAFLRDKFFLRTTSDLQLRGQPPHQLLPKGQTWNCSEQHLRQKRKCSAS